MTPAPGAARPGTGAFVWRLAAAAVAGFTLLPLVALVATAGRPSADLWSHLAAYVLPAAVLDTTLLLAGVGVLAGVLGTGTAWLVTAFDFPGRRLLTWGLLLPLAVPTYIVAYAYLDLLHPVGPVQTVLRDLLGVASPRDLRLPDIRSLAGCIVLLGFVLYPYVYLSVRAVFLRQSAALLDAARTLGVGRARLFARVALPLARPAVAVGVSLVLLETLNDIGASEFLGVRTLTVSIYTTWITRSNLAGATQLALVMLLFVFGALMLERLARRHRRYAVDVREPRLLVPHPLTGWRAAAASAACLTPVLIGFVAPSAYLVQSAIERLRFAGIPPTLWRETAVTLGLATAATVAVVALGLLVVYAARLTGRRAERILAGSASLGYAVPGTVLALGILPIVTGFDALIDRSSIAILGTSSGMLLLGSGAAIVYAYVVRFLALGSGSLEAGFSRIPPSLDEVAQTLGEGPAGRLRRVHLPLLRPALATAALLVFVDAMKELPATLLLRPLGFETLATHLYGEAIRGTYEDAAIAAVLIVAAGLVPVVVLARVGYSGTPRAHGQAPP